MANDIVLGNAIRSNITAINRAQRAVDTASLQLSTGRRVNSSLDDPQSFFASLSLQNRASDLNRLLDGIGQSVRTLEIANSGVESALEIIDLAEAFLVEAEQELRAGEPEPNIIFDTEADFTSYSGAQDVGGDIRIEDDGRQVTFDGNLWKQYRVDYEVTEDTILEFEFRSTNIPEIAAIGFDTNDFVGGPDLQFFLYGEQLAGITYDAPVATFQYDGSGEWRTVRIDVGTYRTGFYPFLHFINDDDGPGDDGESQYRNIILYEDGDVPTITPERAAELERDYGIILDQLDALVEDAQYRGVNLLGGENLTTDFNEDRDNNLETQGIDATALGLGLAREDFTTLARVQDKLEEVRVAKQSLRSYGSTIASDLGIITTREDFSNSTINTLESGADDFTLADQNAVGADLLASQVRLQLAQTALSLGSNAARSILDIVAGR